MFKSAAMDKWDAGMPGKPSFVHDCYFVGRSHEEFHMPNIYMYQARGAGWTVGVNKKLYNVSSHGICVDSTYIGKSEI